MTSIFESSLQLAQHFHHCDIDFHISQLFKKLLKAKEFVFGTESIFLYQTNQRLQNNQQRP